MVTKYLYLDDANQKEIEPFIQSASRSKKIEIDLKHPAMFNDNFDSLIKSLSKYAGIILDWRLDEVVVSRAGKRYPFRAGALAQELRSRASEGAILPMPIILWSATQKFQSTFQNDYTAQDLFDRKYRKEEVADFGNRIAVELDALASGYEEIYRSRSSRHSEGICELLRCGELAEYVDIRVRERFVSIQPSVYEIAHFILDELIDRPGLLIEEERLAARLGVNLTLSSGWGNLRLALEPFQYKGPFSSAWQRWWNYGIAEQWWFNTINSEYPLSALTATERIEIIAKVTGINDLVPAMPLQQGYHERFYTICEETKLPLDPIDGVIIDESQPEPWQERRYISIDVALRRKSQMFRPHPLEKDRLKALAQNG